ncbi:hypothetical protein LPJ56_006454, partial [Coemansia sp. RSA 2599]
QLVRQMRIAERIDDDWAIGSLLATPAMPSSTLSKDPESMDSGGLLDDLDDLE